MRSTYRSPRSSQRSTISKKTTAPTTGISYAHPTTERPSLSAERSKPECSTSAISPEADTSSSPQSAQPLFSKAMKDGSSAAMEMLGEDAILCGAVYPGHPEGALEGKELTEYFSTVSRFRYSIAQIRMVNSPESPFFTIIETK